MKCTILSRKSTLYATKRLAEEGRKLGMKVSVKDTLRISVLLGSEQKLYFKNKLINNPDIVIPRIGSSITAFGGSIMFQMHQ